MKTVFAAPLILLLISADFSWLGHKGQVECALRNNDDSEPNTEPTGSTKEHTKESRENSIGRSDNGVQPPKISTEKLTDSPHSGMLVLPEKVKADDHHDHLSNEDQTDEKNAGEDTPQDDKMEQQNLDTTSTKRPEDKSDEKVTKVNEPPKNEKKPKGKALFTIQIIEYEDADCDYGFGNLGEYDYEYDYECEDPCDSGYRYGYNYRGYGVSDFMMEDEDNQNDNALSLSYYDPCMQRDRRGFEGEEFCDYDSYDYDSYDYDSYDYDGRNYDSYDFYSYDYDGGDYEHNYAPQYDSNDFGYDHHHHAYDSRGYRHPYGGRRGNGGYYNNRQDTPYDLVSQNLEKALTNYQRSRFLLSDMYHE